VNGLYVLQPVALLLWSKGAWYERERTGPVVIDQLDVLSEAHSAIIPFVDSISHESSS